jgi:1-acyl-sn-glycerol-3-phosphate acyltransferase
MSGFLRLLEPLVAGWHRAEVRGLENVPEGPSLLVSNHSGGFFTMDFPILAMSWAKRFGIARPLYLLAHSAIVGGPSADLLRRMGLVPASSDNAREALRAGAPLLVFPGGDYDAGRPTSKRNIVDFAGRTGYVATALEAGVPIVPVVSIGGQENQLYLARGRRLAQRLGTPSIARLSVLPITFGFPWGPSLGLVAPLNLPLPTKIVTVVLPPVDIHAEFGPDPDRHVVDEHVRKVMQAALDELARQRRFPVIG